MDHKDKGDMESSGARLFRSVDSIHMKDKQALVLEVHLGSYQPISSGLYSTP